MDRMHQAYAIIGGLEIIIGLLLLLLGSLLRRTGWNGTGMFVVGALYFGCAAYAAGRGLGWW